MTLVQQPFSEPSPIYEASSRVIFVVPSIKGKESLSMTAGGVLEVTAGNIPRVLSAACRITGVVIAVRDAPTTGPLVVDVNLQRGVAAPTTIFTTQANRPTILVGHTTSEMVVPDIVDLLPKDVLYTDIDQPGGASHLGVTIELVYS